jgi:signal transduction histidine kinase
MFLRVLGITLLFLAAVIGGSVFVAHTLAQELYISMTVDALKGNLQNVRNVIATDPETRTPPPTADEKRQRLSSIIKQRFSLLDMPPASGIVFLGPGGKVIGHLGTGSHEGLGPYISSITSIGDSAVYTFVTPSDDVMAATYLSSWDVQIVAFNRRPFTATDFHDRFQGTVMSLSALSAVMLFFTLFFLLKWGVVGPQLRLVRTMRNILENGRFDMSAPLEGTTETRALSRQFNTLLQFLSERDTKLRAHTEKLEEIVSERTAALLSTQQRLVQQERLAAIGEFSSSLAHELRNPLSSIKMGIDHLFRDASLAERNTRRLELVRTEIDRLDAMLKGVLSFASTTPTQPEPLPLADLIQQAQPSFEGLAQQAGVTLEYVGLSNPHIVRADRAKFVQAVINVVKNACEAAPKGSVVKLVAGGDGTTARLSVTNGGTPIPDEVRERLFEPFFTTKTGGTGLGLPTTKRLMVEMGGDITLESSATLGTTATLTVPLLHTPN